MTEQLLKFVLTDFDGFNVGIDGHLSTTWLVFDSLEDAEAVIYHWLRWVGQ